MKLTIGSMKSKFISCVGGQRMNSRKPYVLIVDDSEPGFLYDLLGKRIGINVCTVNSLAEALGVVAKADFDLILMNWSLPDCDGLVAQFVIREKLIRRKQNIAIICVTARAMLGDREKCLSAGMDDYLSKPFTIQQLREVVYKWLPQRSFRNRNSA